MSETQTEENQDVSSSSSSFSVEGHITQLEDDQLLRIFAFLDHNDLVSVSQVCTRWYDLTGDNNLWRRLFENQTWDFPLNSVSPQSTWKDMFIRQHKHEKNKGVSPVADELPAALVRVADAEDDSQQVVGSSSSAPPAAEPQSLHDKLSNAMDNLFFDDEDDERKEAILASGIRGVLSNSDLFSVEEVINNDEYFKELRRIPMTDLLMKYLQTPKTVQELFRVTFLEPLVLMPEDLQKRKRTQQLGYQSLINMCTLSTIVHNEALLLNIHNFLSKEEPLPFDNTVYRLTFAPIAKLIETIFEKYPRELSNFFSAHQEAFVLFINYANEPSTMDLLMKFVESEFTHEWLHSSRFIPGLISKLTVFSEEDQENAISMLAQVLCQANPSSYIVTELLNDKELPEELLKYITSEPLSVPKIRHGVFLLNVLLNLVSDEYVDVPQIISTTVEHLHFFATILEDSNLINNPDTVVLSTGAVDAPLGVMRLNIMETILALVYAGFPSVTAQIAEEGIFSIFLDLFFRYKWNNIVHNCVYQTFSGLLCGNDEDLLISVLKTSRLVERIVETLSKDAPFVGHLGHLRTLACELMKVTKYSSPISTLLENNDGWMDVLEKLKDFEVEQNVGGYSSNEENYSNDYNDEYEEYELAEEEDQGEEEEEEEFGYDNEEVELEDESYDQNSDEAEDDDDEE